eukprot:CAMPEP_0180383120 /NCGR_PEP_ID=MMETSP0989-20121125/27758_1 /TAXON_ID=697907 /ORGANISM="non described non described, Strain CCMP2293" /LENGTH=75 /DNA_ID=CAMNT_0022383339 /DNA_START=342 /DNA_END=566 /DNA_ORIENTATION=-
MSCCGMHPVMMPSKFAPPTGRPMRLGFWYCAGLPSNPECPSAGSNGRTALTEKLGEYRPRGRVDGDSVEEEGKPS